MSDSSVPYLVASPIWVTISAAYSGVTNVLEKGTVNNLTPIAKKTPNPPADEEPMTIFWYSTSEKCSTHVAAYYRGERMDFYPANVAAHDNEITKLATLQKIVMGKSVPERHLKESVVPDNFNNIQCYNIYPSQLGIDSEKLLNAMKQQKRSSERYNLYDNNCADQIIDVFEKAGLDMSAVTNLPVSLPSNVRNFAQINGYRIDPRDAPFTNDSERVKELLAWIKDPQEMLNKYTQLTKQCPSLLINTFSELNEKMYKTATEHPETYIAEINNIITKNPSLSCPAKTVYTIINNLPEEDKNKIKTIKGGEKLLADATSYKKQELSHTLATQAKIAQHTHYQPRRYPEKDEQIDRRTAEKTEKIAANTPPTKFYTPSFSR